MSDSRRRLLIAGFVAPFIGAFVGVCFNMVLWRLTRSDAAASGEGLVALLILPIWVLVFGSTISLPAMLLLGLPTHVLLYRIGWRNLVAYLILGAIGGWLTHSIIFGGLYMIFRSPVVNAPDMLPLALTIGVATSTAFWLIRRPDRDRPNPATRAP